MRRVKRVGQPAIDANFIYLEALINSQGSGGGSFATITGDPTDNAALVSYVDSQIGGDTSGKANLAGGNAFTGDQAVTGNVAVTGNITATGALNAIGAGSQYTISRRDNNAQAGALYSTAGDINFYHNTLGGNIWGVNAAGTLTTISSDLSISGTITNTALTTALGLKAALASPTFTGTPTLPTGTIATTQSAADSTTAVATTAFVTTANNLKANLASPTFTGTLAAAAITASTTLGVTGIATLTGGIQTGATAGSVNFFAFGGATATSTSTAEILFGGAATVGVRIWERGSTNYPITAGHSYGSHIIGTQLVTEAASGVHAFMAQFVVNPLTITGGVATATDAATVFINGASTGGTFTGRNDALRVSGTAIVTGKLTLTDTFANSQLVTGSTGQGGLIGMINGTTGTADTTLGYLNATSGFWQISQTNSGGIGVATTGSTGFIQLTASGSSGYIAFANGTGGNINQKIMSTGNTMFQKGGTYTDVPSALVVITSTTQGFLLPRMTKAQRDAISTPVAGLSVYQTDNTPGLRVYNGTNWIKYTETTD